MSFLDQDQPIDYSNRYNENIGSISPRTLASRSNRPANHPYPSRTDTDQLDNLSTYSTLSNSQFGDSHMQNSRNFGAAGGFSNNFFNQNAFSQNNSSGQPNGEISFKQNNRQPAITNACRVGHDFVDCTYLYENTLDACDSVTVYQTEDTPIPFSNISSVSSLSLERLPVINANSDPTSLNLHSIGMFKHCNIQTELNSSGDSLVNYNMENSPYCFSCESTSPLSLDLNSIDGELTPETLELFNTRILKKQLQPLEQDITSMVSGMSIDQHQSTRSSTERLNRREPYKFGRLNEGDEFSLLDQDLDVRQAKQQPEKPNANRQPAPKFSNPVNSVVVNHQQSQSQERNSGVDFEQGFDDDDNDNEVFYLNKCISFGRMANSKNTSTSAGEALSQSTRSSTERLNRREPCNFGRLNEGDEFSLLDQDLDVRQAKQQPEKPNANRQPAPKFSNPVNSVVVNHQQSQSQERNSGVDFEQGFDDDDNDNEVFYLNKCISFGRMANSKNASTSAGAALSQSTASSQAFTAPLPPQLLTSQPPPHLRQFSSSPAAHTSPTQPREHQPEAIPYTQYKEGALPFNKKELLKQREAAHNQAARTTEQFFNHPVMHHQSPSPRRNHTVESEQFITASSPTTKTMQIKCEKQVVKLDNESEIGSTISSEFAKKYSSRDNYTIDGKEEKKFSSVPFAPIMDHLKYAEYTQKSEQALRMQKQQFANQQNLLNNEGQVKPKGIKKKLLKTISWPFKNL